MSLLSHAFRFQLELFQLETRLICREELNVNSWDQDGLTRLMQLTPSLLKSRRNSVYRNRHLVSPSNNDTNSVIITRREAKKKILMESKLFRVAGLIWCPRNHVELSLTIIMS